MSRPEGNVTGISMITVGLAPKRLELLHQLVPATAAIAMLVNPTSPYIEPETREVLAAARAMGREVQALNAGTASEVEAAFRVFSMAITAWSAKVCRSAICLS